jgi:hypothetical protein
MFCKKRPAQATEGKSASTSSTAGSAGSSTAVIGSGGLSSANTSTGASTGADVKNKKPKIHFKFNQGFSNAVKRPVSILEFL